MFTEQVLISVGATHAAVTWVGQLLNTDGTPLGSSFAADDPPDSILANLGGGDFLWTYTQFPDGFASAVQFTASDGYVVNFPVAQSSGGGGAGGNRRVTITEESTRTKP